MGLHDVGCRFGAPEAQPLGCLLRERRLMAKGFQQPVDAMAFLGRAEEDGDDLALLELGDEILENLIAGRGDITQKLLHQLVIIVGELLEHGKALIGLKL